MARIKIGNVRHPTEYLRQLFAPAGYGWGEVYGRGLQNVAEVNACVVGGVYTFAGGANSSVIVVNGIEIGYANIMVAPFTNNEFTTQIMRPVVPTLDSLLIRHKSGETWGEWEWVNPPMAVGVEYRTTERWIGKPIYTKLIDCGNMLNAEPKTIAHGCEAINVVRCHGATNLGTTIPYRWNDYYLSVSADRTNILICINADFSDQSCVVELYYTKN